MEFYSPGRMDSAIFTRIISVSYTHLDVYKRQPHKRYNSREIIAEMNNVIMNLDTENKILSDTVKWMHDTIWELMHEKRESGQGNGTAPGDCGGYRDFRDCGNCRDREPSEECMEVTAHTGQTEAAYSLSLIHISKSPGRILLLP